MKKFLMIGGALGVIVMAQAAAAVTLRYDITGSGTASFTVDQNPIPSSVEDVPPYVANFNVGPVYGTAVTAGGVTVSTAFNLRYYSGANFGGFDVVSGTYAADGTFTGDGNFAIFTTGPQLYSGVLTNPTLLTGTVDLAQFLEPSINFRLTVTALDTPAAVPEPASWALMIGGFGAIGAAMRRRQKIRVAFA